MTNTILKTGRRRGGEGDVVESNGGGGGFFDMIGDNATTATKEFRSVDVGGGWMNNTTASTATAATTALRQDRLNKLRYPELVNSTPLNI